MKNENRICELSQNGVSKYRGDENGCWIELQRRQSMSSDWAMRHDGWKVEDITDTLTEDEQAAIIEADKHWPVPVTLIDPFTGMNRWIKVRLMDGTETTANTYAMRPQEGGAPGTLALVQRHYLSK